MTKYELVKDRLYQTFDYYIEKVKNCKDIFECNLIIGWFVVETSEIIIKSDLDSSVKKKLLIWVNSEVSALCMYYKSYNID